MATKAELSTQIEHLEHEVRRLKRSVSHLSLDCTPEQGRGVTTAQSIPQSMRAALLSELRPSGSVM